jgi:hypothetical protein
MLYVKLKSDKHFFSFHHYIVVTYLIVNTYQVWLSLLNSDIYPH